MDKKERTPNLADEEAKLRFSLESVLNEEERHEVAILASLPPKVERKEVERRSLKENSKGNSCRQAAARSMASGGRKAGAWLRRLADPVRGAMLAMAAALVAVAVFFTSSINAGVRLNVVAFTAISAVLLHLRPT